ncbi:YtxH domain-containing protein [Candidatus Gracilibacteria bacterium]|jgi:gas vesicle protein|nr:YtxH domain-containing protein [Candidatus Gracilibacteria bacterium]NJM87581.1 YtxH domain-containing protein [Hydrococcus sp. RU_2_2]NJP19437.1 YtxH domain-containing protein [Hydrococcus sp. CRU_1_1]NJQ98556.1 YtxH domain-containing protein [Hydrococcus sp. CSU_1_8]
MKKSNAGAFLAGMLVGGAIGTIAGLLVAPRSGKETRRILKKSADALPEIAEDLSTSLQLQTDRLSESAMRNWGGTLTRLKEAIAAGIEASQLETQEIEPPRDLTSNTNSTETRL